MELATNTISTVEQEFLPVIVDAIAVFYDSLDNQQQQHLLALYGQHLEQREQDVRHF